MKQITSLVTAKEYVHGYRGFCRVYFTLKCGHSRTEETFSGADNRWKVGKSKVRCYECSKIARQNQTTQNL